MEVATMQPTSALHHHAENSPTSLPQVKNCGRTSDLKSNQNQDSFTDAEKYLFSHTKRLQLNGIDQYTGEGKHDTFDIFFDPIGAFTREPLRFIALDMAYASDRPWRATNAQPIGNSSNCYKATLEMHSGHTLQVAIKFGEGYDDRDDLLKEAYVYDTKLGACRATLSQSTSASFIKQLRDRTKPWIMPCPYLRRRSSSLSYVSLATQEKVTISFFLSNWHLTVSKACNNGVGYDSTRTRCSA